MITTILYRLYSFLFSRKIFFGFNKLLFLLGLRGMGILNFYSMKESGEETFIKIFCKKISNPIIFDIGSNEGVYAVKIKKINTHARIYAFEPHPITYEKLKKAADTFNFSAYNLACGSKKETLKLYDYLNNDGSCHASTYKEVFESIHRKTVIEHNVKTIPLDDFILTQNIDHIHLLKIDTEGHELQVLEGLKKTLNHNLIDIIHFEFNEMNVFSRVFFHDFFELLKNYKFYRLVRDGLVPMNKYNPLMHEIFAYQNIIAIHDKLNFQT